MHRDDVGLVEQLIERVRRVLGVRVVRDHAHAEPFEAPLHRASHGSQSHDARGLPRVLPRAVALVGDRPAAVRVAGADVAIGGHDPPGHREEQRHRHLGDRVGVATRGAQHRDPGGGGGGHVDVVGVTPAGADREEWQIEDGAGDEIGLHHEEVGALGLDPGRQLLGVVEPHGLLVDPGVEHHVGEALERVQSFAAERCRHERFVIHGAIIAQRRRSPVRWQTST